MTLTDFLLARIAEDEAATVGKDMYGVALGPVESADGYAECSISAARVLAECEAKRRIMDLHQDYGCTAAGTEGHETCGEREWCYTCGEGSSHPCDTLTALALPYRDHSDFRDFWLP
jgi:hypothetical protein